MIFQRGMHATHTGNAAGAALLFLNDSHTVPNSHLEGDSREAVTIIPPCWTKAELLLGPFFSRLLRVRGHWRISPHDLACDPLSAIDGT